MKDYVSKRLELIFLAQNQAQKELVANENFQKMECLINNCIISTTMTSPPVNPKYSDLYLLSDNSSGEWKGADGKFAFFTNKWNFITPTPGMIFVVLDEEKIIFRTRHHTWKVMTITEIK